MFGDPEHDVNAGAACEHAIDYSDSYHGERWLAGCLDRPGGRTV